MARRILTVFSAVSLFLCLATCALWIRSWHVGDSLRGAEFGELNLSGDSDSGFVALSWLFDPYSKVRLRMPAWSTYAPARGAQVVGPTFSSERFRQWGGVAIDQWAAAVNDGTGWESENEGGGGWVYAQATTVYLAYWIPATVSSISPAISAWVWWRKRRKPRKGVCATCGYDLRATADRCPECGTAPISKPASPAR